MLKLEYIHYVMNKYILIPISLLNYSTGHIVSQYCILIVLLIEILYTSMIISVFYISQKRRENFAYH